MIAMNKMKIRKEKQMNNINDVDREGVVMEKIGEDCGEELKISDNSSSRYHTQDT